MAGCCGGKPHRPLFARRSTGAIVAPVGSASAKATTVQTEVTTRNKIVNPVKIGTRN